MTKTEHGGEVALVTGATRGIGAATARLLAARGMQVVVNYRSSQAEADEVVGSITSTGGRAIALRADVRDESAVHAMVETVRADLGEIEVLVHNALIPYVVKSFEDISWGELGTKVDEEMRAAFIVTKAVVPGMRKLGRGRIVYLSAVLARQPRAGMIALGTAKAALGTFARYLAQELGPNGITVNLVAPGPVAGTVMTDAVFGHDQLAGQAAQTAMGRLATPEEVARVIAFYAGADSGLITGTTAPVDGGLAFD